MRFGYFVCYGKDPHESSVRELEIVGCVDPDPNEKKRRKMVYWDRITRLADPRPELIKIIDILREGDELVIPDLFDLVGSWRNIKSFKKILSDKQVKLFVYKEGRMIEFTGDSSILILGFIKKHAAYQTRAGNTARNNVTSEKVGAPKGPRGEEGKRLAYKSYALRQVEGEGGRRRYSIQEIAEQVGRSKSTVSRWLRIIESEINKSK